MVYSEAAGFRQNELARDWRLMVIGLLTLYAFMYRYPPIDPIAFFNLCLSTSSLTPAPEGSGISVVGSFSTLYPRSPPAVVVVDKTGIVSTTGSAFRGGTWDWDLLVSDGIFCITSVHTALRCHLRLRVNSFVSLDSTEAGIGLLDLDRLLRPCFPICYPHTPTLPHR